MTPLPRGYNRLARVLEWKFPGPERIALIAFINRMSMTTLVLCEKPS
jgi:hypothetical protein